MCPIASILNQLGISHDAIVVTLRPPATEAHYHNPEAELLFAEAVRHLSENPKVRSVVIPRNQKQGEQLREQWADLISSGSMIIPSKPVDGLNLIWFSDLMISGGGTMNREAAALGVPVYSVFRGKIGAVDKYLEKTRPLTLIQEIKDVRTKDSFRTTRSPGPAREYSSSRFANNYRKYNYDLGENMSSKWSNPAMSSTEPVLMNRPENVQAVIHRLNTLAVNGLVPMFDTEKQLFCFTLQKTESRHGSARHFPALHGDYLDGASPARTKRRNFADRYPKSV